MELTRASGMAAGLSALSFSNSVRISGIIGVPLAGQSVFVPGGSALVLFQIGQPQFRDRDACRLERLDDELALDPDAGVIFGRCRS